jgi:predicted nucleotidyltransferase component of viral defense system
MIPQRNISLLSNRLARKGGRRIPENILERDYCIAWFLVGLSRSSLCNLLVFKGGTALKRCYFGDYRFSEDLDFSLIAPDTNFDLSVYEDVVIEALHSFGFEVTIQLKNSDSTIKSAFLKGNTSQHLLNIEAPADIVKIFGQGRLVKIKFEVDTQPPLDFESEKKTLLVPSPFTINTMTLPSLFAGKMHAILCRNWSSRPKGRDWYDLVWYISHGYEVDMKHLNARLQQNCSWQEDQGMTIPEDIDENYILELLKVRIEDLDISAAKRDVEVFISDKMVLDIWSRDFFMEIIQQIRFKK